MVSAKVQLDKMRDSILGFYQGKCPGKTAEDLKALMDAETWISREAAPDYGFEVGDYAGEMKAVASLTRRAFDNAPAAAQVFLSVANPPAPKEDAATPPPAENWEARFKGLSAKFNDLQRRAADAEKKSADALTARDAEIATLKSQLEAGAKDLADANAKVSELSAKLEESANALQAANADLAQTRDSLAKAQDKAEELEKTRDMLTAGVLTPAPEAAYAEKMKAAKTPEEREALRAQKRAGKIK